MKGVVFLIFFHLINISACTMSTKKNNIVCTQLPCIMDNEGKNIWVEGTFLFPQEIAFAVKKIVLEDKTEIILTIPKSDLQDLFSLENNGKKLSIKGKVYTDSIPDSYKIIGRLPNPYMVDITKVTFKQ